jgi:hypothetical protein
MNELKDSSHNAPAHEHQHWSAFIPANEIWLLLPFAMKLMS